MLELAMRDTNKNAVLLIDYQSESIGFTVLHESTQLDFAIDMKEWELLKKHIETAQDLEVGK